MSFLARWAACLLLAFLLYPIAFVRWNGPDRDFGYVGGMIMMMFVQFISPYGLWGIPVIAGTSIAICWTLIARRKAAALTL